MARRWGSSPAELRRTLTYDQLAGYIRMEQEAQADEATLTAYGTLAAILNAIGGKKSKAVAQFSESLRPKTASAKPGRRKGIADYKAGIRDLMLGREEH